MAATAAVIRRSTVVFVTLLGVVLLLATAYLSPFVGNALLGARGPPKTATHSSVTTEEIRITDQTNRIQGYFMARYYEQQMTQDTKSDVALASGPIFVKR